MRIAVVVGLAGVAGAAGAGAAGAQRWQDATARCTGTTAQWSNEVEVADVDGDGHVDLLVANGGNYSAPGAAEPTRVWRNLGGWETAGVRCTEISADAVLGFSGLARTIKAIDVDGDGDLDLLTGGAYQSQLRLVLRDGAGWVDGTARLPQQLTSVGDLEAGDVDADGDLDLLVVDWGAVLPSAAGYPGGRTRLYVNDGTGRFTDATAAQMPALLVRWSWDAELVDVDDDWDLDAVVACKLCPTSYLFRNDGSGTFIEDPDALPHFANNYEFEAMDIDGDGDLDLATLNDGPQLRDHLLVNDGTGRFTDETATRLAGTTNPAADDNAAVWLDADADGDADLLVASLSSADRLLLNDGRGVFTLAPNATPNDTPGSLSIAVVDLDGDGRLDVVQAQGEAAFPEKVQLASTLIAVDAAAPRITSFAQRGPRFVARVHDHQSPSRAHDWQRVWLDDGGVETTLRWSGEYLWFAEVTPSAAVRVCARDRRGNQACTDGAAVGGDVTDVPDAGTGDGGGGGGCCDAHGAPAGTRGLGGLVGLVGLVALVGLRARRRRR